MKKTINPSIFKAYDIRGTYPEELNKDTACLIGKAFASFVKGKRIVVGKDVRISSDELEKAFVEGVLSEGKDVVKIGLATTPLVYFASGKLDVAGAAMITASHNPAQYNGFKFCLKEAVPVGEGSGMEEIKRMAVENEFEKNGQEKEKGRIFENKDIKKEYWNYMASFFRKNAKTKKKIVVDFANAMGILDKEVYQSLSNEVEAVYLFDELDGTFPNHEANPLKSETLSFLCEKVRKEKADFGVAYDGDADRVGFVDEEGKVVPMDFITALLAKEILKNHPGGLVLVDLRSSNAVKEVIEEAGGVVRYCRVGHSLIKKQMREEGAIFAGELSGHYFFEENFKAEMSTLAVVKILNLLNESDKKLSELVAELKKYYHSGEINFEVNNKEMVFEKLKEKYQEGKINLLDGIRIDFSDWWFNVRASNTEPVIRLNLEAKTKQLKEEKIKEIMEVIKNA